MCLVIQDKDVLLAANRTTKDALNDTLVALDVPLDDNFDADDVAVFIPLIMSDFDVSGTSEGVSSPAKLEG